MWYNKMLIETTSDYQSRITEKLSYSFCVVNLVYKYTTCYLIILGQDVF